jgi:YVTN family beta-propeller protein
LQNGDGQVAVRETERDNGGEVEFRVLGPLEVSAAGRPLSLGGRKQRTLLALFVLNANQAVPRDRLIDALWGERPPAEAEANLRVYVARLRKLLAVEANGPALETSARGYVLRVAPDTVDLTRFRRLVAAGEFAHALQLWRGPALADLTDNDWARHESDALEELRLNALEERLDTDLAAGRDSEVVPELEALVAEHPYRERFVAQLMLALYRCGRQPDALAAYGRLRTALHDEFGLEPTQRLRELEREILSQDAALDLHPPATESDERPPARRARPYRILAGTGLAFGLVLLLVITAALVALVRNDPDRSVGPIALNGNSVVAIDESTNVLVGEIPLGGRPSGVSVGLGSVWVGNVDDETLLRIDPRTRRVVDTIGLGAAPTEVAVGAGSVWILSLEASAVLQVDPATNHVLARIPLRPIEPFAGASQITELTFARGSLWLRASHPSRLMRLDPRTHSVAIVRRDVIRISSSGSALWAVLGIEANRVRRLYPPGRVVDLTSVGSIPSLSGFAADEHAVWVASRGGVVPRWASGTLWRIDPNTGRVVASVLLDHASSGIALTPRAVWVATVDGHVLRVDAERARVTKTIALGLYPPNVAGTIASGEGGVWVAALAP